MADGLRKRHMYSLKVYSADLSSVTVQVIAVSQETVDAARFEVRLAVF